MVSVFLRNIINTNGAPNLVKFQIIIQTGSRLRTHFLIVLIPIRLRFSYRQKHTSKTELYAHLENLSCRFQDFFHPVMSESEGILSPLQYGRKRNIQCIVSPLMGEREHCHGILSPVLGEREHIVPVLGEREHIVPVLGEREHIVPVLGEREQRQRLVVLERP
jgi:hypothetical protein